jgi:aspartyl-tRNA(Asn)/glutamyl-tRNA(Gln) amidotransferase subunit A
MGGSGLTSNYGKVEHPFRENGLIGGSSSGSAYLVASGHLPFTIGSDTGDSVRKPAAYAGIVGFKPS